MTHQLPKFRVTFRGMAADYIWRVRGFLDGLSAHVESHISSAQEFLARVVQLQYAIGPELEPERLCEFQDAERKLSEAIELFNAVLQAFASSSVGGDSDSAVEEPPGD